MAKAKRKNQVSSRPRRDPLSQQMEQAARWLKAGRMSDVVTWAQTALQQHSDNEKLVTFAARSFVAAGRPDLALSIVEDLVDDHPHVAPYEVSLAAIYAELGMNQQATQRWNQIISRGKVQADWAEAMVTAWQKRNQDAEADEFMSSLPVEISNTAQLHFLQAIGRLELGRLPGAIESLLASLELDSSNAIAWYNLGVAYDARAEEGDADAAIHAYQQTIALAPQHVWGRRNLAVQLVRRNHPKDAIKILKPALEYDPNPATTYYLLGFIYRVQGDLESAISHLQHAIGHQSNYDSARELLGRSLTESGRLEQAVGHYKSWLRQSPKHPAATHMLAALTGENIPDRASSDYVESAFDDFAATFDQTLERLEYHVPKLIQELVTGLVGQGRGELEILDAGCGTGKCGPGSSPFAKNLVGVDLSSKMLRIAEKRNTYNELHQLDLLNYLENSVDKFDLIIAADTFNYFGDLSVLFQRCFAALRDQGTLIFTLEEGPLTGDTYYLQTHGRFTHAPQYIMQQLGELGVPGGTMRRIVIRKENDREVYGLLMAISKPSSETTATSESNTEESLEQSEK